MTQEQEYAELIKLIFDASLEGKERLAEMSKVIEHNREPGLNIFASWYYQKQWPVDVAVYIIEYLQVHSISRLQRLVIKKYTNGEMSEAQEIDFEKFMCSHPTKQIRNLFKQLRDER